MYQLEYDTVYGVYKIIIGDEIILTGCDRREDAQEYAEFLINEGEL